MSKLEEVSNAYRKFDELLSELDFRSQFVGIMPAIDDNSTECIEMEFGHKTLDDLRRFGFIVGISTQGRDPIDVMIRMYNYCIEILEKEKSKR